MFQVKIQHQIQEKVASTIETLLITRPFLELIQYTEYLQYLYRPITIEEVLSWYFVTYIITHSLVSSTYDLNCFDAFENTACLSITLKLLLHPYAWK